MKGVWALSSSRGTSRCDDCGTNRSSRTRVPPHAELMRSRRSLSMPESCCRHAELSADSSRRLSMQRSGWVCAASCGPTIDGQELSSHARVASGRLMRRMTLPRKSPARFISRGFYHRQISYNGKPYLLRPSRGIKFEGKTTQTDATYIKLSRTIIKRPGKDNLHEQRDNRGCLHRRAE